LAAAPARADLAIKAVTFNIYNRPWERAARLDNLTDALRRLDADVVCLEEVSTGWILPGDPAARLSQDLHMELSRYWHEENLGVFRTGIAVLSKFPILSSEYHEFARHDFWDAKGYMLVRLRLPDGKTLQLICLHMASTSNAEVRSSEWRELAGFAQGLRAQGPVLIGGDFNTEPTDPALREFVVRTGVSSLYDGWKGIERMRTWTPDYRDSCERGTDPASQLIDYFFALPGSGTASGGLRFTGGRIVSPGRPPHPSDHCAVEADVSIR
jgi:endonuclease/exonuclease/phosphatase family metal-dependent hydrolase